MPRSASARPDAAYVIGLVLALNACIIAVTTVSDALVTELILNLELKVDRRCRVSFLSYSGLPDWPKQAKDIDYSLTKIANTPYCQDLSGTLAHAIHTSYRQRDIRQMASMPLRLLYFQGPFCVLFGPEWLQPDFNWVRLFWEFVFICKEGYGVWAIVLVDQALAPLFYIFVMGGYLAILPYTLLKLFYQVTIIGVGMDDPKWGPQFESPMNEVVIAGSVVFAIFALWKAHRLAQGIARCLRALRSKGKLLMVLVESVVLDDTIRAAVSK